MSLKELRKKRKNLDDSYSKVLENMETIANEFLKQKEIATSKKIKYDKLLDEYEKYIDELESKVNLSEKEKEYLNQLLLTERKLRKLT